MFHYLINLRNNFDIDYIDSLKVFNFITNLVLVVCTTVKLFCSFSSFENIDSSNCLQVGISDISKAYNKKIYN
ncbi:hypothetical protein BpHYR1_013241 [Brachionus plicatilis]|uniref:Uncharacterized protein n=1 Tax=Brachionus plicatilis TaxID=10195 RepID=A0A3M7S0S9_BRAPC|nr:hypothetical protein BpHYR1_013241 [Brachionus plicatilis]